MALFFSSLFSMLMRRLTPSITLWTSCTSEKPRRSEFEMSKVLPTAAVSTPPERKKQIIYMLNECGRNLMRNARPKSACSYQFRVSAISVCPKFRQILNPEGKTKCSVLFIDLTEPVTRQIVPSFISAIPCFKRFLLKAFI